MKLLYRCCTGMDVHKKSVSVCIRRRIAGGHFEVEEAIFGTFTQDLERLRQWLKERKVRQVAMESTGVYWIPVWNVLERGKHQFELTLVNPATVPLQKTLSKCRPPAAPKGDFPRKLSQKTTASQF